MVTLLTVFNHLRWRFSGSNGTTKENQMKLKTSLVVGAFSLVLFMCGCTASQTPGPSGPQGQPGATGQTGDSGRDDEQRRTDDRPRGGHDAPCPAGEHRYTNPNSGVVSCVRD